MIKKKCFRSDKYMNYPNIPFKPSKVGIDIPYDPSKIPNFWSGGAEPFKPSKVGIAGDIPTFDPSKIGDEPITRTRDDIINFLSSPIGFKSDQIRWDWLKSMQNSDFGFMSNFDLYGIDDYDTFEDWKTGYMGKYPENVGIFAVSAKGKMPPAVNPEHSAYLKSIMPKIGV